MLVNILLSATYLQSRQSKVRAVCWYFLQISVKNSKQLQNYHQRHILYASVHSFVATLLITDTESFAQLILSV